MNKQLVRLHDQFSPKNYQLKFDFAEDKKSYIGQTIIKGICKNKNNIYFHAVGLNITKVAINKQDCEFNHDNEILEIKNINLQLFNKSIDICIDYKAQITSTMHGIYPSVSKGGDTIIATQFESHHAREAFPCIDEPESKATFDIQITTNSNDIVLSNMPLQTSKNIKDTEANKKISIFDTTPIMSTYLVAFVIGNLHKISGKTKNGTLVSVWSSSDHPKNNLKFALDTSIKTVDFLNEYFGTPYPLPKCDHVALPDFSSGAMENWGLITYREVCLLVDPKTTSTSGQESVATVITHELSHQWFGNLVTMKWWNDLWLNESFATLMEYIVTDKLFPEWNIMLSFAAQEALSAFRRDMLPGVQAVATNVSHPDQISTLFDPSIVYAKGARLLLMAYNLVGDEDFRLGLKNYFAKYQYSNTEGNDLWQELEKASGKKVGSVMNSWINTAGFPVVRVKQVGTELYLKQRPLRTIRTSGDAPLWQIPLSINPHISLKTLKEPEAFITLKSETYVQLNTDAGHYSVHYETQPHRRAIISKIEGMTMNADNRLLFINDQLMLARSGIIGMDEAIDVLSGFIFETEEPVWSVISLGIADARKLIEGDTEAEKSLQSFTWNFVKNQYYRLGWQKLKKESLNDTKLRGVILGLATYSEEPMIIKAAIKEYKKYSDLIDIPADTRHIILNAAIKNGSKDIFNKLFKEYPSITNAELAADVASALANTKDKDQIKQILDNLKNDKFVRLQDVNRFIIYMLFNKHAKQPTWKWLKKNWPWIIKNFKSDKSYDNYPRYAASAFNNEKQLKDYKEFFGPLKKEPALTRNIELGLAEIENRVNWRKRDEQKLTEWLTNQQYNQS